MEVRLCNLSPDSAEIKQLIISHNMAVSKGSSMYTKFEVLSFVQLCSVLVSVIASVIAFASQ